jgi:hypothetical protein
VIAPGLRYGTISGVPTIRIAQDEAADELLSRDPLALLIGMLLDQHMCRRSSGTPQGVDLIARRRRPTGPRASGRQVNRRVGACSRRERATG